MVQFCNKYIIGPSQKKSFRALEKWKMNSPWKENENSLRQHCLEFQDAPLCTIWDHLNKLCHECGHKIDHLAWKPWIFTLDSSFLRTLFKIIIVLQVYYFCWKLGHIWWHNAKVFQFFVFIGFFMPVSKCGQNGGLDRSYLVVESSKTFDVYLIKLILMYL